jgi:hypothetical protein
MAPSWHFYIKREVKPRRIDSATRIGLTLLSRDRLRVTGWLNDAARPIRWAFRNRLSSESSAATNSTYRFALEQRLGQPL